MHALAVVGIAAAVACGDDGGTGTGSGTDTGTGSTTAGVEYGGDGQACAYACNADPADCCAAGNHPSAFEGRECPREDEFPANWACDSGGCVQEYTQSSDQGCTSDADCMIGITGYACHPVNGVGACVEVCQSSSECRDNGQPNDANKMFCTGSIDGGGSYCEPTAPPS